MQLIGSNVLTADWLNGLADTIFWMNMYTSPALPRLTESNDHDRREDRIGEG